MTAKHRLVINCATRGRPELLKASVSQTLGKMDLDDTLLMISLDEDDEPSIRAAKEILSRRVMLSVLPREDSLGAKYNRMLSVPAECYLAMVDYAPHTTQGFDKLILAASQAFPDGIAAVVNHLANASFPQINAASHGFVKACGYFYEPYYPYWFIDHAFQDIAKMLQRQVFADVLVDVSKRPGTQELRDPYFWSIFYDMMAVRRRALFHQIVETALDEPPWRKAVLQSGLHHHIEYQSQWINDQLRRQVKSGEIALAQGDGGPRYARLKAQAIKMLGEIISQLEAPQEQQDGKASDTAPASIGA